MLSQSLQNFGFDALYHSTGPPYNIQLDVQGELAAAKSLVDSGSFATDLDFQEHMQAIFQKTIDAHTRYQKPACYSAVFVQPFAFDMRVNHEDPGSLDDEPKVYLMHNLYTEEYKTMYPDIPIDSLIGQEVVLLNGVELTTEVSAWGDTHETKSNNPGIRFNAAIRSYLYRSAISVNILPVSDLAVTLADGSQFAVDCVVHRWSGRRQSLRGPARGRECEEALSPPACERPFAPGSSGRPAAARARGPTLAGSRGPHCHRAHGLDLLRQLLPAVRER